MVIGEKRSGSCDHGYGCSSNSERSAEKIKKMHDDCHYFNVGYCNNYRAFYSQTVEEIGLVHKIFTINLQANFHKLGHLFYTCISPDFKNVPYNSWQAKTLIYVIVLFHDATTEILNCEMHLREI